MITQRKQVYLAAQIPHPAPALSQDTRLGLLFCCGLQVAGWVDVTQLPLLSQPLVYLLPGEIVQQHRQAWEIAP